MKCRDCKFLRELWWWEAYSYDKKYGYCCVALDLCEPHPNELGVAMQLQEIDNEFCEMYTKRSDKDGMDTNES